MVVAEAVMHLDRNGDRIITPMNWGFTDRAADGRRTPKHMNARGETVNLDLMLLVDKQFLDTPFYGVRQMTWHLQNEGHAVNEKRIRRLMRLMRLMPIYQKPNTSKPAKGHKTYPASFEDFMLGSRRIFTRGETRRAQSVLFIAMPPPCSPMAMLPLSTPPGEKRCFSILTGTIPISSRRRTTRPYLVFWFGTEFPIPARSDGREAPTSAEGLETMLLEDIPTHLKGKLEVVVLDVSRPAEMIAALARRSQKRSKKQAGGKGARAD